MSDEKPTKLKLILEKRKISQSELYDRIKSSCFVQTKNGNEYKITPNEIIEKDEFIDTQLKRQ